LRPVVKELADLGFGTVWLPGRTDDVFDVAATYLQATEQLVIATGIVSIWLYGVDAVAAETARLHEDHPGRFLLGLGVSHGPLVNDSTDAPYRRPLELMERYLLALDEAGAQYNEQTGMDSVIAALGPRMLELAQRRTQGTHPYLVTPEHTALARATLGPDKIVAVGQTAIVETDPVRARSALRAELSIYLGFPNYVNNWRRLGFTEDDFSDGGSDRLVDRLFVWGDAEAVAARLHQHLQAGATHACVKVVGGNGTAPPIEQWRAIGQVLRG
jgi:probable F420-dependent oxidoreductase